MSIQVDQLKYFRSKKKKKRAGDKDPQEEKELRFKNKIFYSKKWEKIAKGRRIKNKNLKHLKNLKK